jgi:hypothetical protein
VVEVLVSERDQRKEEDAMSIVTIGKLEIDTEKLSEDGAAAVETYAVDGEFTDELIEAIAEWSNAHRNGNGRKDGEESKSSKMRKMSKAGVSTGAIADALGVRYQFVNNVLRKEAQKIG